MISTEKIIETLERLVKDSNLIAAFWVDENNCLIASDSQLQIDKVELISFLKSTLGTIAILLTKMKENEFYKIFGEKEWDGIHISKLENKSTLIVVFNHRTSLALVRLRVSKAIKTLTHKDDDDDNEEDENDKGITYN